MSILIKKSIVFAGLLVIVVFLLYWSYSSTQIASPKVVLENYLEAIQKKDAKEAAKFVFDERFPTPERLEDFYNRSFKYENLFLTGYQVQGQILKEQDRTEFEVAMQFKDSNENTKQKFILMKRDGNWKIYIPPRLN
ncbi:nuclear transport factor 2 family protein [Paenibacillus chitinolyticus]|uniref:hypothetical protein n=1 Tax=Paenibacillus chitinolyticus TaxID=79263 RepID=UPI0036287FDE